jgi:hypothetical protein
MEGLGWATLKEHKLTMKQAKTRTGNERSAPRRSAGTLSLRPSGISRTARVAPLFTVSNVDSGPASHVHIDDLLRYCSFADYYPAATLLKTYTFHAACRALQGNSVTQ